MTRTKRATSAELIFAAVCQLAEGATEFDEFTLAVKAWEMHPERFGMIGWTHPDMKLVYAALIKMVGTKRYPAHNALIERCRPNTYRLTGLGFREKQRLEAKRRSA